MRGPGVWGVYAVTAVTVGQPDTADAALVLPDDAAIGVAELVAAELSLARRILAAARLRWPLLLVMVLLSIASYHLLMVNTAFLDEGTYLSAGHVIWHNWLHGGPDMKYPTYFSGAPVIYPVIAAAANAIGGLALARVMSLGFVLATVSLLYATTNRLYGRRAAAWAAAVFATVSGTQFLATLATYDAMALMLLTLSVWVVVRYADSGRAFPHGGILLGAPILGLANATKYASGLFDPVVIAMVAVVVASRYGWRLGLRSAVSFATVLAAGLSTAIAIAGHDYANGVMTTTVQRPPGIAAVDDVLRDSVAWVGMLAGLGVVAIAIAFLRRRVGRDPDATNLVLVGLLVSAVALAPVEQARIHTTVSLEKHVAFGAWFASIAVGWMLSCVSGARWRDWSRWVVVLVTVVAMAAVGRIQAVDRVTGWTNSAQLMASLRPYIAATDKQVLMDDADVATYYLGADQSPTRWINTYYFAYAPAGSSTTLYGSAAYAAAIADDHFGVVALNFASNPAIDKVVRTAIQANPRYRYVGEVVVHNRFGWGAYKIWVDLSKAAG